MIDYRTMIWNRNKFIALTVVIVILAILYAVAMDLPSAERFLATGSYSGISVGSIIKAVIAILMIVLTLVARPALKIMLAYYGIQLIKEKSDSSAEVKRNVKRFAGSMATLIALAPLWVSTAYICDFAAFSTLTFVDVSYSTAKNVHDWSGYLPMIIFVPVLLVAVIKCIIAITVVSGAEGRISDNNPSDWSDESDKRIPEGKKCPECKTMNPLNARFCSSCGMQLRGKGRAQL